MKLGRTNGLMPDNTYIYVDVFLSTNERVVFVSSSSVSSRNTARVVVETEVIVLFYRSMSSRAFGRRNDAASPLVWVLYACVNWARVVLHS